MTAAVTDSPVKIEDITGVQSRVSWAAILGGSVIAIAAYLVLTFFFAALGMSLTDAGVRANAVGIGAIVAAVLSIVVALFLGGWVTTQLSVGENKREAMIYGVLTWAVVTAFSLGMVSMGIRAGYFALVSGTVVAQQSPTAQQNWDDVARQAGVTEAQIASAKTSIDPAKVRATVNDPANREAALEGAAIAAWSALAGTLLSIAASLFGALAGRGAAFRLFPATALPRRQGLIVP